MFEDILQGLEKLAALDGTTHEPAKSREFWSKSVELHATREEAMNAKNANSIKKHQPLIVPRGMTEEEATNKAVEKYVDDLIGKYLNG